MRPHRTDTKGGRFCPMHPTKLCRPHTVAMRFCVKRSLQHTHTHMVPSFSTEAKHSAQDGRLNVLRTVVVLELLSRENGNKIAFHDVLCVRVCVCMCGLYVCARSHTLEVFFGRAPCFLWTKAINNTHVCIPFFAPLSELGPRKRPCCCLTRPIPLIPRVDEFDAGARHERQPTTTTTTAVLAMQKHRKSCTLYAKFHIHPLLAATFPVHPFLPRGGLRARVTASMGAGEGWEGQWRLILILFHYSTCTSGGRLIW